MISLLCIQYYLMIKNSELNFFHLLILHLKEETRTLLNCLKIAQHFRGRKKKGGGGGVVYH